MINTWKDVEHDGKLFRAVDFGMFCRVSHDFQRNPKCAMVKLHGFSGGFQQFVWEYMVGYAADTN
jgi:hypothetical protein